MRYAQGLAVAALILVAYVLASGGLDAPPQASPSPAPVIAVPLPPFGVQLSPLPTPTPPVVIGPVVIGTHAPVARPTPTPRHVLHSGPPLH